MLVHTKGIGAGGFRARLVDGALAANGGASPSPRWDGLLGRIGSRRAPRPSIKVRQRLPGLTRYVVIVGRQEPTVRAPRAGLDTVPRPSVHMALAAGRAPHRHNAIPAAGDADRDHIGDAVEGAQRGQPQTAVAGPPPSGAGRTLQRRSSRACARRRRRSCRRRSCVPPPGAARQCRAGVVVEHSEQVGPPSLSSSVSAQQSRLVGAVLAEQHDEWAESRRYLGFDVLGKSRNDQHPPSEQEAHPAALTA
jgi:hypothetical protein